MIKIILIGYFLGFLCSIIYNLIKIWKEERKLKFFDIAVIVCISLFSWVTLLITWLANQEHNNIDKIHKEV